MAAHKDRGLTRRLLSAIIVLALLAPMMIGLSILFQPKNNQAEFGMIEPSANGFLGEPDNTLDVLFVGDSEVFASYSPLQMWHERGFTSYDASSAGQKIIYGKTLLKRAFAKHSPRVVVFETDSLFRDFSISEGVFREMEDVLPVLEYHNRWKSLTLADVTSMPQTTWSDENKGFVLRGGAKVADTSAYGVDTGEITAVPRNNAIWLRSMVDICRKSGAVPLLMSSPSPANWSMAKHHGVQSIADELGIAYVDLNLVHEEMGLDWREDTYDGGDHLNYHGARKVSKYVGAYLSKTYGLPDRRKDSDYTAWNAAYKRYAKRVRALLG